MYNIEMNTMSSIFYFFILLIPFGVVWCFVYSRFKNKFKTVLEYSVLTTFTLVCFLFYVGLWVRLSVNINGLLGRFMKDAYCAFGICVYWALAYSLLFTLTLGGCYFIKCFKNKP